jgi:hypothetical protein
MQRDPIANLLDAIKALSRGPSHHSVDLVALIEQQLGQI